MLEMSVWNVTESAEDEENKSLVGKMNNLDFLY